MTLNVSFPEVDWSSLQSVYGWSALQYQAWARGYLEVNRLHGQTIALFACGLLEFSVDGERHFGGDFYGYRRVPVILHLSPGKHTLDLRLVRDVRALGASSQPTIEVEVEAEERQQLLGFGLRKSGLANGPTYIHHVHLELTSPTLNASV